MMQNISGIFSANYCDKLQYFEVNMFKYDLFDAPACIKTSIILAQHLILITERTTFRLSKK